MSYFSHTETRARGLQVDHTTYDRQNIDVSSVSALFKSSREPRAGSPLGLTGDVGDMTTSYLSFAFIRPARASSMTLGIPSTRSVGAMW